MTQLTLGDIGSTKGIPTGVHDDSVALYQALETIAGSTILEFDDALHWAQWCRRMATDAITQAKIRSRLPTADSARLARRP